MKKLFPKILVLMIVLCSCNANKSFLHQRYTHFKHKKATLVKQNASHVEDKVMPGIAVTETLAVNSGPAQTERLKYTKAVIHRAVLPFVSKGFAPKGKEKTADLECSSLKLPATTFNKIKPVKVDQKQKASGLLWGVIDAILAIVVLAAFVGLILWIIWLYNPR